MATVNLSPLAGAGWQLFSSNGVPLSGGLIYTYAAGTTTPLTTYTSSSGSVANSNPIVLDSAGRVSGEIWIINGSNYKFVIKDSNAVTIGTYDNISGINDFTNLLAELASTATVSTVGASLIGFKQGNSTNFLTGAVASTVYKKLQEIISVKDFGAVGDGITDDTDAIQAAIAYAKSGNGLVVYMPAGTYLVSDTLTITPTYSSSQTDFYQNLQTSVGLKGDGQHATWIVWASTIQPTVARKAVVVMGGYSYLEDLTLISKPNNAATPATYSAYYGVVTTDTSWKMSIRNVGFTNFAVPFSANIIKTYKNGANGLEFEPATGGVTWGATDLAQFAFYNCRFTSNVIEFKNGTYAENTTTNANGTILVPGTAASNYYDSTAFSDGCYAFECNGQASVAFKFDTCTFESIWINIPGGTIRLNNVGNIVFDTCLLSAPTEYTSLSNYTYSLFENVSSGGSDIVCEACYFIGGIYHGNTSQGTLRITDCNGENVSAFNAYLGTVNLFAPLSLPGALNTRITVNGLYLGRGSGTLQVIISQGTQASIAVCPYGAYYVDTGDIDLFYMRDFRGIGNYAFGSETTNLPSRTFPAVSLIADCPTVLNRKQVDLTYLDQSVYLQAPGYATTGFSNMSFTDGEWVALVAGGSTAVYAPMTAINANCCYNISVQVYVKMNSGYTIADLSNDIQVFVRWFDSSQSPIATSLPIMLGAYTPTLNYSLLVDDQLRSFSNYHIIPPTGASYMALVCSGAPNVTKTAFVGFSKARIWEAGTVDVSDWIPLQRFASTAAPTTGTWLRGDVVWRSDATSGQNAGWMCTASGTPGTWRAMSNLA